VKAVIVNTSTRTTVSAFVAKAVSMLPMAQPVLGQKIEASLSRDIQSAGSDDALVQIADDGRFVVVSMRIPVER
jgi:hypothetical protein